MDRLSLFSRLFPLCSVWLLLPRHFYNYAHRCHLRCSAVACVRLQQRLARLETYLNVLLIKLELVEHHMEHELVRAITTAHSHMLLFVFYDDVIRVGRKGMQVVLMLHQVCNGDCIYARTCVRFGVMVNSGYVDLWHQPLS
jgi:hypothetical protein